MRLSSTRASITSKTTGSTATPPDDVSPTFVSAATNTAGTLVILTYNEALSSTTAATSAFAVTRAGAANAVTAVAVSGSTVELTVTDTIETGQAVTVAYTDPSGSDDANAIQDLAGNDAATLGSTSVTNNSTVAGSSFNQAQLSFRYHMFGAAMSTVWVYWQSGATDTLLFSKTGQQHTAMDSPWTLGDSGTLLHNKDGETGYITIVAKKDTGFQADAAFCEFSLTTQSGTVTFNTLNADWKTTSAKTSLNFALDASPNNSITTDSGIWRRDIDTTPSGGTGPDKHHDNSGTTEYLYFEASGPGSNSFTPVRTTNTITL